MPGFSPSDAAVEGFRLTRERPLPVLVWSALRLAYNVVALALLFGLGGSAVGEMMALQSTPNPAPEAMIAVTGRLAPAGLAILLLSLLFYSVIYTAVLRAVLRPGERGFAYLRLSMDEARQFALAAILFALLVSYALLMEIVAALLIQGAGAFGPAAAPLKLIVILALLAAFLYPAVRLSLAPSMTFVEGRLHLFRSLPLSRGRFWSMFGTYGLAAVLTAVVGLLAMVIFTFAVGAIGMAQSGLGALPALFGMMKAADLSVAGVLSPLRVANLVFTALLGTLAYLILFAPAAAIFRDLTGRVAPPPPAKSGQPWG